MFKARPCQVCGIWFRPDPMVGERQHACGNPACQKERHRRACARFHDRDPDYAPQTRFTAKLDLHHLFTEEDIAWLKSLSMEPLSTDAGKVLRVRSTISFRSIWAKITITWKKNCPRRRGVGQ